MNGALVDEKVKVWVLFDPLVNSSLHQDSVKQSGRVFSHIFPVAMNWKNRIVKFEKLIFMSNRRVGDKRILSLTCASESASFELEYENDSHLWKLKKVAPLE